MANDTPTTAADMPDQAQQNSPLMKLPTELRLRIYKFAFEDIIDDIVTDAASRKREYQEAETLWLSLSIQKADHPIFVGVLSFLHANRELRRECLDALLALTRAFQNVCYDQYQVATKACRIPIRDQYGNLRYFKEFLRVHRLLNLEHGEALNRLRRVDFTCDALAVILWDDLASPQRKLELSKQRRC